MNENNIKAVSRNSKLSLKQVEEVFSSLPLIDYSLVSLESFGDKNKHISLMDNVDQDFFTRELDNIIINKHADIAIHSAKDLPYPLPQNIELFSLFDAVDKTDSLVSKNNLSLAELPIGSRVGTSSATRKSELLKLRPDLIVVSIRGTIEERIAQIASGFVDALIVATCALKRLGLNSRIAEVLSFKTHALQGNLAIVGHKDNVAAKSLFHPFDIRKTYGQVTLVGFGPGNPDLLTIGGDKALVAADIIFHDDLLDKDFLDKYNADKIYVGKRKNAHSFHQDDINELIYQAAISGKNVVRLKGGDPMVFAHGREEIDFLQSRFVEVQVIPGISSGIALAAYTHIPLTHRGIASSVAFVTGHAGKGVQIPDADTLVYYMGGANMSVIASKLVLAGRNIDTPVALVHNVSLPDQKTYFSSLRELQYSTIKYPTPILIIIGDVVAFEKKTNRKPNVLVTGTTSDEYQHLGNITHTPLIKIDKIDDNELLYNSIKKIRTYDWIIFTSRYAVRYFFETLKQLQMDARTLAAVKIASVGKTTSAELNKHQIVPDLESSTESAEGVINFFNREGLKGKRILLPRSDKGLQYLSHELNLQENVVDDVPIYTNKVNDKADRVDLASFQKIVFTSPSCIDAFIEHYGNLPEGVQLVARGKTTDKRIKSELYETL